MRINDYMNYNFRMPTEIISGYGAIEKNADKLVLGKCALIVTGKRSAKACGALDDVTAVLDSFGIKHAVFDKVMENPLLSVCFEGGQFARQNGADFVIAIGGGSPIDAAKAISAFAANPGIEPMEIYTANLNPSFPIVAIPTTAGTGSEVNPYSVLTLDGKNVKKTFNRPMSYPKYAILDPKYTYSLSVDYTVSTALDAFCHCIESYLSPKAGEISRLFALDGAKRIYSALVDIENSMADTLGKLEPYREQLLYGACAGGIAINATGTGFNHPLGYNLTLYNGISHGRACGAFMKEYLTYNSLTGKGKTLIESFASALGDTPDNVAENIVKWSNVSVKLTGEEIALYVANVKGASNYANSPYVINETEMKEIYTKLFG